MEHPTLSILICHLKSRKEMLDRLLLRLSMQTVGRSVEIKVDGDDGEKTIGRKRNDLLFSAKGEYVAFIDDDDDVSDDYVSSILAAIETKPDCVGIEGIYEDGHIKAPFKHSIQFQGWYTGTDAFYRTPNHLNPVKTSIAQQVGFPSKNFGEDHLYSDAIRRGLKTEVYINHPIYFYKKVA